MRTAPPGGGGSQAGRPSPGSTWIESELGREYRLTAEEIAAKLKLTRSTVAGRLTRRGLGRRATLEPRPPARRYQRARAGELVHFDVKKLARFCHSGHRVTGEGGVARTARSATSSSTSRSTMPPGWPASRSCRREARQSVTGFLVRTLRWFKARRHPGRACDERQRPGLRLAPLAPRPAGCCGLRHIRTRPYTPKTTDVIDKSFLCKSFSPGAWVTAWRRAGREVEGPAAQPLSSHLGCGARAHLLESMRVPAGDEAGIGCLGLLDPAPLLLAMVLDVVGVSRPLLAPCRSIPRFELKISQLFGKQRRTRPHVALALGEQVPDDDRELAGGRDGRDVLAATGSASRRKKARSGPGARTAAEAASTSMPRAWPRPLLGDPSVIGRPRPRLTDAWVQAEIADEPAAGSSKRVDCRRPPPSCASATTMSTPGIVISRLAPVVGQSRAGEIALNHLQVLTETIELAQVPLRSPTRSSPRHHLLGRARPGPVGPH